MKFLLNLTNAANVKALTQTNFERLEPRVFQQRPSEIAGIPTDIVGPPATGVWEQYDLWVDARLALWRCETGGEPGTWIQITPAITEDFTGAPDKYLITSPTGNWQATYYDLATDTWLPVNAAP